MSAVALLAIGLVLRPFVGMSSLEFEQAGVSLAPNPPMKVGLAFDYDGIGASLGLSAGSLDDEAIYGQSDALDLSLYWYGERWGADLLFQIYEGLHTDGCDPEVDAPCAVLDAARVRRFGATVYHGYDAAFSPKVAFAQARHPVGSSGSWFSSVSVDHADFGATGEADLQLTGGTLGGGYGHLWISDGGWYFSPLILVGVGPAWVAADSDRTNTADELRFQLKANLKMSGGYHGEWIYWGFAAVGDTFAAEASEDADRLEWRSLYAEWFIGFRL